MLVFFGNVIFFNLAVAVLLSAFEDDEKQEEGITAEDDEKQEEGITAELRGEGEDAECFRADLADLQDRVRQPLDSTHGGGAQPLRRSGNELGTWVE